VCARVCGSMVGSVMESCIGVEGTLRRGRLAMKLGGVFGYWGAGPRVGFVEEAQAAERLGYDSVWVAESWGNDAFTYAAYVAANTSRVKIGPGSVARAG